VFDGAFVVINEQARRRENLREPLLHPVKLNGSGNGVGGATAELALVINRRALRAKVNFGRQYTGQFHRCGVKMVALIRQIGQPAVTGNLVAHKFYCRFLNQTLPFNY
jgi:hypothetical protein